LEGFVLPNDRVNISKCSQHITQRTDREVFILTNLFNYYFGFITFRRVKV